MKTESLPGALLRRYWSAQTPPLIVLLITASTSCGDQLRIEPADDVPARVQLPELQANELETRVLEALSRLGLQGEATGDNLPGGPANVRVIFPDGTDELVVNATPLSIFDGQYHVVNERSIAGNLVQRIRFASGRETDAFTCDDVLFESSGPVPPGFGDFDSYLGGLIRQLGCAQEQLPRSL